jgi:hypothetical protein
VRADSRSADAARAAVAAAAALGVTGVEPAILADGSNVIVHLSPSPLVAKAERLPDCRQRAAELLATWRTT